ncbi:MAG TPA: heparinase II/III family protein [Caulobacteraceae bacterium]|nr:heparinase II/III family protein [Caulobacteraceae bacterium]
MNAGKAIRIARLVPRLGLANVATVAAYRLALKSGRLAMTAPPPDGALFREAAPPSRTPATNAVAEAEDLLAGRLAGFGGHTFETGAPPDWRRNLFTGALDDPSRPWWAVSDDDARLGDIKGVWEASRFDWAVVFARAAAATSDARFVAALNAWAADWSLVYPPYQGANWRCGQEASIRLLQAMLAARLLDQDRAPQPALLTFVRAHLTRVAQSRLYAMAQDNNHGISEAAALFVAGAWLAANGEPDAERWARAGRSWLENRVRRLFFADGGFSQYSTNYHRLALDMLSQAELWRRRLALQPFSPAFRERAAAATRWLAALTNVETGDAPNLGANDGARVFRLDDRPFRDHRGSVQLAAALFLDRRAFPPGPWDAALQAFGLDGSPLDPALSSKQSRSFSDFGLTLLNPREDGGGAYAFVRVPSDRFRPSQADPLHFDLWTDDGRNLLRDGGSWSYFDRSADAEFGGIAGHNTVQFDERDAMPRLSRFLYADWISGRTEAPIRSADGLRWAGEYRDAYGGFHRREVEASGDRWRVTDTFEGAQEHATLRWRLAPGEWRMEGAAFVGPGMTLEVDSPGLLAAARLIDGRESRRYGEATPCPVLEYRVAARSGRFVTDITLGPGV